MPFKFDFFHKINFYFSSLAELMLMSRTLSWTWTLLMERYSNIFSLSPTIAGSSSRFSSFSLSFSLFLWFSWPESPGVPWSSCKESRFEELWDCQYLKHYSPSLCCLVSDFHSYICCASCYSPLSMCVLAVELSF